jgi:hypothetical protein
MTNLSDASFLNYAEAHVRTDLLEDVLDIEALIRRDHMHAWDYIAPSIQTALCDAAVLDFAFTKQGPTKLSLDDLVGLRKLVRARMVRG